MLPSIASTLNPVTSMRCVGSLATPDSVVNVQMSMLVMAFGYPGREGGYAGNRDLGHLTQTGTRTRRTHPANIRFSVARAVGSDRPRGGVRRHRRPRPQARAR